MAPPSPATALRPPIQVDAIAILNCTTLKTRPLETTSRERKLRQAEFPGPGAGNGASQTGRRSRRSLADFAAPALVQNSLCRGRDQRTMRESDGRFSMTKVGITVTAFFLLLG